MVHDRAVVLLLHVEMTIAAVLRLRLDSAIRGVQVEEIAIEVGQRARRLQREERIYRGMICLGETHLREIQETTGTSAGMQVIGTEDMALQLQHALHRLHGIGIVVRSR